MLNEIDVLRKTKGHKSTIGLIAVYESEYGIHFVLPYLRGGMLIDRILKYNSYTE